jgi:hypothetical protein
MSITARDFPGFKPKAYILYPVLFFCPLKPPANHVYKPFPFKLDFDTPSP